jgi:hypothetical protein
MIKFSCFVLVLFLFGFNSAFAFDSPYRYGFYQIFSKAFHINFSNIDEYNKAESDDFTNQAWSDFNDFLKRKGYKKLVTEEKCLIVGVPVEFELLELKRRDGVMPQETQGFTRAALKMDIFFPACEKGKETIEFYATHRSRKEIVDGSELKTIFEISKFEEIKKEKNND